MCRVRRPCCCMPWLPAYSKRRAWRRQSGLMLSWAWKASQTRARGGLSGPIFLLCHLLHHQRQNGVSYVRRMSGKHGILHPPAHRDAMAQRAGVGSSIGGIIAYFRFCCGRGCVIRTCQAWRRCFGPYVCVYLQLASASGGNQYNDSVVS